MSEDEKQPLVVGVGSPFGDDQLGWRVTEELGARDGMNVTTHQLKVPHCLMDVVSPEHPLHVVDAYQSEREEEADILCFRVDWDLIGIEASFLVAEDGSPIAITSELCSTSSHQLDLVSVLTLANQLGRLPDQVTLWALPARTNRLDVNETAESLVTRCADRIAGELSHA